LPEEVCDVFGYALFELQSGKIPYNAKPMHGPLRDVIELVAVDIDGRAYRLTSTITFVGVIYVLHVFQKKSTHGRSTPKRELDVIEQRLRLVRAKHER
jgi:phage-related protein